MKISIILLIRDGASYIDFLNEKFKEYKNNDYEFFIYENNSLDKTNVSLSNFFKNHKGRFRSERLRGRKSRMYGGISMDRGEHMMFLRNSLKKFHGELDSDYTLLIDADSIFNEKCIDNMINFLEKSDYIASGSFGICYDVYNNSKREHYYDSLSMITMDDKCFINTQNSCFYKECEFCKEKMTNLKLLGRHKIEERHLISRKDNISEMKSFFGGFFMLKTNIYNKISWGKSVCEHHSFCSDLRKYGNICINNKINTIMTIPKLRNYNEIYELLNSSFS